MRLIVDIRKNVGKIHDEWDGEEYGTFRRYLSVKKRTIVDNLEDVALRFSPETDSEITVKLDMNAREAHVTMHGADKAHYQALQDYLWTTAGNPSVII